MEPVTGIPLAHRIKPHLFRAGVWKAWLPTRISVATALQFRDYLKLLGIIEERNALMRKTAEIEQPGSCLNKSAPDEPIFVLCARDPLAASTVEYWAKNAEESGLHSPEKAADARHSASQMREWRADHPRPLSQEQARAANKFGVEQSRPPYGAGIDDTMLQEHYRREQIKGYKQTVALTAGSTLLVSMARDKDGEPLTDADLREAARAASRFASFLALEMFPEETGNG